MKGGFNGPVLNGVVVMGTFHAEYSEGAGIPPLPAEVVAPGPEATGVAVRDAPNEEQPALAA